MIVWDLLLLLSVTASRFCSSQAKLIRGRSSDVVIEGCTDAEQDCGPQSCCVVGFVRFSIPKCKPLADKEEYCRPADSARSMELYYPQDMYVNLDSAYVGFCPCKANLTCSIATSRCVESALVPSDQYQLEDYYEYYDGF